MARNEREHQEQVALFQWINLMATQDPRFLCIFAIPNGGQRNVLVAAKLKAEGVRAGVPDLFVAVPSIKGLDFFGLQETQSVHGVTHYYHGLFIEMKVKPNTVKREQKEWLSRLAAQGYKTMVCWSWSEAQEAINEHFGISTT